MLNKMVCVVGGKVPRFYRNTWKQEMRERSLYQSAMFFVIRDAIRFSLRVFNVLEHH